MLRKATVRAFMRILGDLSHTIPAELVARFRFHWQGFRPKKSESEHYRSNDGHWEAK